MRKRKLRAISLLLAGVMSVGLFAGQMCIRDSNYSACIGGYNTTDQLIYCKGLFHSESIGGSNRARLSDPKVDELIEEAMVTLDADERQKIVEELNAYLNELCVHIPLWQPIALRAYNAKLKGVEINAVGNLYFQNCYWEE